MKKIIPKRDQQTNSSHENKKALNSFYHKNRCKTPHGLNGPKAFLFSFNELQNQSIIF